MHTYFHKYAKGRKRETETDNNRGTCLQKGDQDGVLSRADWKQGPNA